MSRAIPIIRAGIFEPLCACCMPRTGQNITSAGVLNYLHRRYGECSGIVKTRYGARGCELCVASHPICVRQGAVLLCKRGLLSSLSSCATRTSQHRKCRWCNSPCIVAAGGLGLLTQCSPTRTRRRGMYLSRQDQLFSKRLLSSQTTLRCVYYVLPYTV